MGAVNNNILTYLKWRGDLSFSQVPFNEVDGLILSELSYIAWEKGIESEEKNELRCLYEIMKDTSYTRQISSDEDADLFMKCSYSSRFGNMVVSDYVSETDESEHKQFAAITFKLSDNTVFISFRGTDGTITGWEEDCNLAFSEPIPAQLMAIQYLNKIALKTEGHIRVGGHSKGGNLAVYSAAIANNGIRDRIVAVYNYDGPGLSDRIDASNLYKAISTKLNTFVPKSSFVGMLLQHAEGYLVVNCDSLGVFQHNPYCWHVNAIGFDLTERAKDSEFIENVVRAWLSNVDDEERKLLIDGLFKVIQETDVQTFNREIVFKLIQNPLLINKALQTFSTENKKRILKKLLELSAQINREATIRQQTFFKDLFGTASEKVKGLLNG